MLCPSCEWFLVLRPICLWCPICLFLDLFLFLSVLFPCPRRLHCRVTNVADYYISYATFPKGKLVFAAGVGVLTYLIRVYGGYPDGVAFSVLIMNMCVPLIDALTQPRVFGHEK